MAARAQDRHHDERPDQGRHGTSGEEHQEVRQAGRPGQHGRRVAADAEERGACEVQHAGVAELDVEAQAGDDNDEDAGHEQEGEVVLAQDEAEHGDGEERERLRQPLRRGRQLVEEVGPGRHRAGGYTGEHQERQRALRLRPQECPGVERAERCDRRG